MCAEIGLPELVKNTVFYYVFWNSGNLGCDFGSQKHIWEHSGNDFGQHFGQQFGPQLRNFRPQFGWKFVSPQFGPRSCTIVSEQTFSIPLASVKTVKNTSRPTPSVSSLSTFETMMTTLTHRSLALQVPSSSPASCRKRRL